MSSTYLERLAFTDRESLQGLFSAGGPVSLAAILEHSPHLTDVPASVPVASIGSFLSSMVDFQDGTLQNPASFYVDLTPPPNSEANEEGEETNAFIETMLRDIIDHSSGAIMQRRALFRASSANRLATVMANAVVERDDVYKPMDPSSMSDPPTIRELIDPDRRAYGISYYLNPGL